MDKKSAPGFVSLLELSAAQVEAVMSEIDTVSENMTNCFLEVSELLNNSSGENQTLGTTQEHDEVDANAAKAKKLNDTALVQMQTFDRTLQRLTHLRDSLFLMADGACDDQSSADQFDDLKMDGALALEIKSLFSIAHEKELFDLVSKGVSRSELIALSQDTLNSRCGIEDELF